ncbi:MAG: elongation factor Ts [Clostridiales bacterium]|nr:MAG: elongation factor Ts [Clostridiales bacterium]
MSISAKDVKALRERTGCGMMDCKKALTEAGGDIEKAAEILREKGLASAVKKAGRIAAEGVVAAYKEGDIAVLLEVNCETDFVAKTEQFKGLVNDIAKIIVKEAPADVEALMAAPCEAGTVEEMMKNAVATIGENMKIRRFVRVQGYSDTYIHLGGKIGVLVQTDVEPDAEAIHDVAMQIAAAKPTYISKEDVDADEIAHEKEILRAQAINEGKPEKIVDKMVEGRIQKYYKEVCLLEQPFVKDDEKNVAKMIGGRFNVLSFVRYEMGEGLEKRNENFAEEIQKQMNG